MSDRITLSFPNRFLKGKSNIRDGTLEDIPGPVNAILPGGTAMYCLPPPHLYTGAFLPLHPQQAPLQFQPHSGLHLLFVPHPIIVREPVTNVFPVPRSPSLFPPSFSLFLLSLLLSLNPTLLLFNVYRFFSQAPNTKNLTDSFGGRSYFA